MNDKATLRDSPLNDAHEALGASFTAFGAWSMPLKYGSELDEHKAVRNSAGLFDLSHMGEVRITGADAAAFLDYALISKISAMATGKAKYSMMVNERGGILDDLITYRLGDEEFLVVPNAANTPKIVAEFQERAKGFDVSVVDESTRTALIALQGPRAEEILLKLVPESDAQALREVGYYASVTAEVAGIANTLVARTGYTGEDGFELFVNGTDARTVWDAALAAGSDFDLLPAGLAARDSLRLEAAMSLYGNELTEELTPVEAGLGVLVSKKKENDFVGKDALIGADKPTRVIVGLSSTERRAARAGAAVYTDADSTDAVGEVTSGQPSPTLGHPIALAYLDRELSESGTEVQIDIRGRRYPFTVVETPFYQRSK